MEPNSIPIRQYAVTPQIGKSQLGIYVKTSLNFLFQKVLADKIDSYGFKKFKVWFN